MNLICFGGGNLEAISTDQAFVRTGSFLAHALSFGATERVECHVMPVGRMKVTQHRAVWVKIDE